MILKNLSMVTTAFLVVFACGCTPDKQASPDKPGSEATSQPAGKGEAPAGRTAGNAMQDQEKYFKRDCDVNNKEGLEALKAGEYDRAEGMLLVALQQVDAYPKQYARRAMILNNLASVYEEKEMFEQALPLMNKSQKLFIRAYGRLNPAVSITLTSMGRILVKQKRFEEARQVYKTAVGLMEESREKGSKIDPGVYKEALTKYLECLRFTKRGGQAREVEEKLRVLD